MASKKHHLLLIDDDRGTLRALQLLLRERFQSAEAVKKAIKDKLI